MSSSLYSFSDDEEEEIWEDPSSDGKLVTSLRNMPFAGDSPLWQGVELRHRLKLNESTHDRVTELKDTTLVEIQAMSKKLDAILNKVG